MSDEAPPAESPEDPLRSLTALDFGPSWARAGGEKNKEGESGDTGTRHRDERGDERRDGRRDDRREGKGGQGRRDGNRGGRGDNRDRGGQDRRGGGGRQEGRGGGGGGRRFEGGQAQGGRGGYQGGRGRRDDDRGRPERQETPAPEGFKAVVMPVEEGLDGLAKEILAGGRTYSVFDLAKLVLGARERFNVSFQAGDAARMFRCKKDGSIWLTKAEALQHFWSAPWRKDYYEEVVSETSPPSGNFQAVARCGISGEWLGPPNYHGYQPAIARLHRERFGNMPLDLYKKKVRMERGEEAVNAWLEKMSKRLSYRPTGGVPREASAGAGTGAKEQEAPGAESFPAAGQSDAEEPVEAGADAPAEESAPAESAVGSPSADENPEVIAEEVADEADPNENAEEATAESPAAPTEPMLCEMRDVERHFVEHYFDDAFHVTNRAWVSGNISGNHLSPGLLTLLRLTVAEERRYPGRLTPALCRQLSGRHVAVFKWGRKLKAGPSRPHPVPAEIVIADRPKALLAWITENSGKKLPNLWKALLPEGIDDKAKLGWYHDLHWLLNQGYVLLMADSTVHLAKGADDAGPPKQGRNRSKKSPDQKTRREPKPEPAKGAPGPERAAASGPQAGKPASGADPVATAIKLMRSGPSGLYAIRGRTLSGLAKSPESLSGRGLWPQLRRLAGESEDDEPEAEAS